MLPKSVRVSFSASAVLFVMAVWMCVSPQALAQTAGAVEAARPRAGLLDPARAAEDTQTPAEGDLLLLVEHDLFFVSASSSINLTNNAARTDLGDSDTVIEASVLFGAQTTIADHYDVSAWSSVFVSRYQDADELDSDSITFGLAGSRQFGDYRVGGSYTLQEFNARAAGSNDLTDNGLSLFVERSWMPSDRSALTVAGTLQRFISDPNDFSATEVGAAAFYRYVPSPKIVLDAALALEYQMYDDYFEDFFGESREDFVLDATLNLSYEVWPNVFTGVNVFYSNSFSSLDIFDFDALDVRPGISVFARF